MRSVGLGSLGVALVLLFSACEQQQALPLNGYVEADPIRLAASAPGRLVALTVNRGDQVQAGQLLFQLDADNQTAQANEANARLAQATAQAADLDSGKRPDELAVLTASLAAAEAEYKQAESDLQRQGHLAAEGFLSPASLDGLRARRDAAKAQVNEAQAQLRAARLAARDESRKAAAAAVLAGSAQVAQAQWGLAQMRVSAPAAAQVEDSYYRVGEWVPAGSPVLSLLAPGAIKARFWVSEAQLSLAKPGNKVMLRCDGCGAAMPATIRFLARTAEYTPPIIYSKENRAKLVWLAEAVPALADAMRLRPGQPVDVTLNGAP